jgi:hypothetical protein
MQTDKSRPDRLEQIARALLALALAAAVGWVWLGGNGGPDVLTGFVG